MCDSFCLTVSFFAAAASILPSLLEIKATVQGLFSAKTMDLKADILPPLGFLV